MQFIYLKEAGENNFFVKDDIYKYVIKARRSKVGDILSFRNLNDNNLYKYKLTLINKKDAQFNLTSFEEKIVEQNKKLNIIWAVVDSKTIEKQLPYLNEIGVEQITFFYGDYSQHSFKLNFDKYEKILTNSSQQCGRSSIIKLKFIDSLDEVLKKDSNIYALNFSSNLISNNQDISTIVIGCEGGFSKKELEKFDSNKIVGLNSNLILRSETAITVISSKILL